MPDTKEKEKSLCGIWFVPVLETNMTAGISETLLQQNPTIYNPSSLPVFNSYSGKVAMPGVKIFI